MATNSPRISIVMVDGSFRESYHAIDFFCTQTIPAEDYELIWVEYYDKVNPALQAEIDKYPNARIITLNRIGVYHSSYCFNAGIQASRGELILIPDADLVVEPDLLETVWNEHQTNDKLVMYLFRYEEPEEVHQQKVTLEHLRKVGFLRSPSNFGACLTVRKKWLVEINGYEQHPIFGTGFHANGSDVNTRFKNLGLHIMWHPGIKIYHPWHPMTKAEDIAYRYQEVVTRYRAINLITQAYQGLDASLDRPFPLQLEEKLAQRKAEIEKPNGNNQPTLIEFLRRAVKRSTDPTPKGGSLSASSPLTRTSDGDVKS